MILDLVMPGVDGFESCIRRRKTPASATIPVIVASAKGLSAGPMRTDRIAVTSYGGLPSPTCSPVSVWWRNQAGGEWERPSAR